MTTLDLTTLEWKLSGWIPEMWRLVTSMELGASAKPEIAPIPCRVPGSVQKALFDQSILPDWNVGVNSRLCEWVENRHWIFETHLAAVEDFARLHFEGLDGIGEVWIDNQIVLNFDNAFVPYEIEVGPHLGPDRKRLLKVVFKCPPRWLGQVGFTSGIKDWKPRYNYTWDWTPRNVQIGIFGKVELRIGKSPPLEKVTFYTSYHPETKEGAIHFSFLNSDHSIPTQLRLWDEEKLLASAKAITENFIFVVFTVEAWQPNGIGEAKLYRLEIGDQKDARTFLVGFRHIEWKRCQEASASADPWLCCVNGRDTFLQGINWTPIRPHFADLNRNDYELRLKTYHDMGFNCIRVWGGGFSEYSWLYELCDELGLLVWQDFPLSSSGVDNWPPEDLAVIREALQIAKHYVHRLQVHASLLLWCGGNELQGALDGDKQGIGKPATLSHPLLSGFDEIVREHSPLSRFVATTSTGPRFTAEGKDFGKNLHWDVHGPWAVDKVDLKPWQDYWMKDDALFRSEVGHAGAQSADLIRRYLGDCSFWDATLANPYWHRVSFWFELPDISPNRTRTLPQRILTTTSRGARNARPQNSRSLSEHSRTDSPVVAALFSGWDTIPFSVRSTRASSTSTANPNLFVTN